MSGWVFLFPWLDIPPCPHRCSFVQSVGSPPCPAQGWQTQLPHSRPGGQRSSNPTEIHGVCTAGEDLEDHQTQPSTQTTPPHSPGCHIHVALNISRDDDSVARGSLAPSWFLTGIEHPPAAAGTLRDRAVPAPCLQLHTEGEAELGPTDRHQAGSGCSSRGWAEQEASTDNIGLFTMGIVREEI